MKIAVITGASSGLGKEFALAVDKNRKSIDEIWLLARREDKLNEVAALLNTKCRVLKSDITDSRHIESFVELLKSENAEISLLINNAGFGKLGMFYDISTEDNAGMIRLNCEALTVMTSVSMPFMAEQGEIINTCSIASFAPNSRMAVYSSTKAFVMSFSRALRNELKPKKINVLSVCPGPMETEFLPLANIGKGDSHTFDTLPRDNPKNVAVNALKASKNKKAVFCDHPFYKFYRLLAKLLPTRLVMKLAAT